MLLAFFSAQPFPQPVGRIAGIDKQVGTTRVHIYYNAPLQSAPQLQVGHPLSQGVYGRHHLRSGLQVAVADSVDVFAEEGIDDVQLSLPHGWCQRRELRWCFLLRVATHIGNISVRSINIGNFITIVNNCVCTFAEKVLT